MPIAIDVNREKKMTTIKISGNVPFEDLQESISDYYKGGATASVIVDLRDAKGRAETYSYEQIFDLAKFIENIRKGRKQGKTALVASKDLYFGLCRTLEGFKGKSKIKYETFRNLEDAVEWIEGLEE